MSISIFDELFSSNAREDEGEGTVCGRSTAARLSAWKKRYRTAAAQDRQGDRVQPFEPRTIRVSRYAATACITIVADCISVAS
jgi:hypothetical protein